MSEMNPELPGESADKLVGFGKGIQQALEEQGKTLGDLARALSCELEYAEDLISDRQDLTKEDAMLLAKMLEVPFTELLIDLMSSKYQSFQNGCGRVFTKLAEEMKKPVRNAMRISSGIMPKFLEPTLPNIKNKRLVPPQRKLMNQS